MVITRSQARSRQPLDRAASPEVNILRRVGSQTSGVPQQSSSEGGVVSNSAVSTRTVGGGSVASAAGSVVPDTSHKCRSD